MQEIGHLEDMNGNFSHIISLFFLCGGGGERDWRPSHISICWFGCPSRL